MTLQQLPGHYVGVMLHDGEYYLVAIAEAVAKRGSHKINGLRGSAREYYLSLGGGIDIFPHSPAGGLLAIGGFLRECMHASVHIGLVLQIHLFYAVPHLFGSLRCGGIIEIHQTAAMHLALQRREVAPYLFHIIYFHIIVLLAVSSAAQAGAFGIAVMTSCRLTGKTAFHHIDQPFAKTGYGHLVDHIGHECLLEQQTGL